MGELIMKHTIVVACAALMLAVLGSPLRAQQAPAQQSVPEAPPPPAPAAETLPPPPPFPPMPSSRPSHRWVDVGGSHASRARHRASATRHHATRTKHRRSHAHRQRAHKARPAAHFSRKTIRSCHAMKYSQILRHSSCRALMKQELAATTAHRHRHAPHRHATHRHKSASHRTRHHRSAKRRTR
jgi:hypothetical protein